MAITKPVNTFIRPFADTGAKNTIPANSQIGTSAGAASLSDGFPPLTMTPIAAGGVPPSGKDMNGILNQISQHTAWMNAGGNYQFDSAIAAAGGYPVGAILYSNDWNASYRNVLAGNTSDFNNTASAIGTSWMPNGGAGLHQTQSLTSFTTTGTAPAYLGALTPAPAALAAGLRAQATVHAANNGAASTLNLNALGAKSVKQYDATGAKVAAVLFANNIYDVVFDGIDYVIMNITTNGDAGAVVFFARATAPAGYLSANGAAISRATYANLFAAIGTVFGAGDGTTTFNVPDLRGEFVRGLDAGRGVDAGRALGGLQAATAIRTGASDYFGNDVNGQIWTVGTAFANADMVTGNPNNIMNPSNTPNFISTSQSASRHL
jgi:microcystin-dependent protein